MKGKVVLLGKPGMYRGYSASPDGQYLLVSQIKKPFSYLVPQFRFPLLTEIWTTDGTLVQQVADLPSGETIPKGFDSVIKGRRSITWRGDKAATLVWAEALDGGDMSTETDHHDSVYTWAAPFKKSSRLLLNIERRFAGIQWGNDTFAMVTDWRFSDRQLRSWKFSPATPNADKVLFQQRSYNDQYNDPGRFVTEQNQYGVDVIKLIDNSKVLLIGRGASAEGNIPFMGEFDFSSGNKSRKWHSEAPYYEQILLPINADATRVLTLRESISEQPNFFIRDITTGKVTQFTEFPHPSPAFIGINKELIKYKRKDGVDLSGTLYLPPGYDKSKGPIPVLMWAYPREYKDNDVASQVTESPYEFVRVSYWALCHILPKALLFLMILRCPSLVAVMNCPTIPSVNKLPHEQHGYQARESLLHLLWEQHQWLQKYVVEAE